MEHLGGTLGEQLVVTGAVEDDALTEFYRQRLLVPQVNPNTLARLAPKVVAQIPSDMAIELRAIPVSLDGDNNLTVAMSDPSDRHAVDEIAFFTGAYVVRAVATQMQIAWCLAHYYGHVTALGQRLLQTGGEAAADEQPAAPQRTKGLTGKVDAMRHRALAPVTKPVEVQRPIASAVIEAPSPPPQEASPTIAPSAGLTADDVPLGEQPRARSVSGEIRIPVRRAQSIKPEVPSAEELEESGPVIVIEAGAEDEATGPRKVPPRRRQVEPDPPELYARAGEIVRKSAPARAVDDEPRVVIADDMESSVPRGRDTRELSGEIRVIPRSVQPASPSSSVTVEIAIEEATTSPKIDIVEADDDDSGAVIHSHMAPESAPILLDRKRDDVVVLDAKKPRAPRPEKKTRLGIAVTAVPTRPHRLIDAEGDASSVPTLVDDGPTVATMELPPDAFDGDTSVDAHAADAIETPVRPGEETPAGGTLAPPPPPRIGEDTNPHMIAAPPPPQWRSTAQLLAQLDAGEEDDEAPDDDEEVTGVADEATGPHTSVMTAADIEAVMQPEPLPPVLPASPPRRRIEHDEVDDGWGPPGTTIPPPLLGAIPGSDDEDGGVPGAIPIASVDSAPLIMASPLPAEVTGQTLVRALEEATTRAIELIRSLEHANARDEVVAIMVQHLAETHQRAGFFVVRPGPTKGSTELSLFSVVPKAPLGYATLRLDRPSTLQDVVGTRLPYRGPMHDDASRQFLAGALGTCPPEILLVPVAVRERVVGVLFGEHRTRLAFDDQLALAARAAGLALERVLKSKRG
ncbi:MAG TPA: hypothetical protein VGM88_16480 [Kofleriaceae bacterium]